MTETVPHSLAGMAAEIPDVETIPPEELLEHARVMSERGLRFVTATCLDAGASFEIYYHFADGADLCHLRMLVPKGAEVPSISGIYLAAFLAENEIKELFGVPITGIAIDYHGHLFLTEGGPVTPMLKTKAEMDENA